MKTKRKKKISIRSGPPVSNESTSADVVAPFGDENRKETKTLYSCWTADLQDAPVADDEVPPPAEAESVGVEQWEEDVECAPAEDAGDDPCEPSPESAKSLESPAAGEDIPCDSPESEAPVADDGLDGESACGDVEDATPDEAAADMPDDAPPSAPDEAGQGDALASRSDGTGATNSTVTPKAESANNAPTRYVIVAPNPLHRPQVHAAT
jgi:hypothetical protein